MLYIFLNVKKKKFVGFILLQIFNKNISVPVIYGIFDIHELTGFTDGSSFFILLKILFWSAIFINDRIFVIYDGFSNTSCRF